MPFTLANPPDELPRENRASFGRAALSVDTALVSTTSAMPDVPGLDLAAELAHDVRSPMGAVALLAELLQTGACGPVTAQQKYQLTMMQQAVRSIANLTSDVIDYGNFSVISAREPIAPFDVADVLRAVGEMVQPLVQVSGLKLMVRNFAPGQWVGRRAAITRVMLNLVTNSLEHSCYGVVEFGARPLAANKLEFFVRDTGAGFDPDTLPFARLTAGGENGERGHALNNEMGLVISRRLLAAMNSTLDIESRPGEGSHFRFTIALPARS